MGRLSGGGKGAILSPMRIAIGRPVRRLLLMVALGCVAIGCSGDALVSAGPDASGSPPDGGGGGLNDAGQSSFPDGAPVCTLIGCEDQVWATVTVDATQVPASTYAVSVTADGTVGSCTVPFPPKTFTLGAGTFEECSSGSYADRLRPPRCARRP